MIFGESALTFREFAMGEKLPLALVHQAVLEFLRDRDDGVVFGAQAVNAYVDETRMTQDVDIVPMPEELIAHKVTALVQRGAKPKGLSDRLDLLRLLLAFPNSRPLRVPFANDWIPPARIEEPSRHGRSW